MRLEFILAILSCTLGGGGGGGGETLGVGAPLSFCSSCMSVPNILNYVIHSQSERS